MEVIDKVLMVEKECFRCKITKPVTEFNINKHKKTGYLASCKDCLSHKVTDEELQTLTKECCKCGETKLYSEYYKNRSKSTGVDSACKICKGIAEREYDNKHRDEHNTKMQKYRAENPEKTKAIAKRSYYNNHDKILERDRDPKRKAQKKKSKEDLLERNPTYYADYVRVRRFNDPYFRLVSNLRIRIVDVLRGKSKKSAGTMDLLGCDIQFFKQYLESKFLPTMTWENYGSVWHIDHSKPIISFDLFDPLQQKQCFHYTNLQPLFATTRIIDGVEYIGNLNKNARSLESFSRELSQGDIY